MKQHEATWIAPLPLWTGEQPDRERLGRPAILRFASDTFMDDFLSMLEFDPVQMAEFVAEPEDWRSPMPTPDVASLAAARRPALPAEQVLRQWEITKQDLVADKALDPGDGSAPAPARNLKLYQPAHQRYYLVASSLVCRRTGLPDRAVNTGAEEQVGFVMRRFIPPEAPGNGPAPGPDAEGTVEYALVSTATGVAWQPIADEDDADHVVPGEEQLPMFRTAFSSEEERARCLFAGLIPVSRQETYANAPEKAAIGDDQDAPDSGFAADDDPRLVLFQNDVAEPWKSLIERAASVAGTSDSGGLLSNFSFDGIDVAGKSAAEKLAKLNENRSQVQTVSWYVLLDLAKLLERHLPNVWAVLVDQQQADTLDPTDEKPFFDELGSITIGAALAAELGATAGMSLKQALQAVLGGLPFDRQAATTIEGNLESVDTPYETGSLSNDPRWPSFLFPLADPQHPAPLPTTAPAPPPGLTVAEQNQLKINHLAELFRKALPAVPQARMPAPSLLTQAVPEPDREAWFAIRCVYERPNCFPFHTAVVSPPTEFFQLAGFFDADAPARPIRIGLPVDISPAGLRKHNKNAGLMISSLLCAQLKRIKKLTLGDLVLSVLPWPFHKDLPDQGDMRPCGAGDGNEFGMICSLSIPIVTLCALILLIIMVSLFDFFFKWMPYLFLCFPLPKFKGKK